MDEIKRLFELKSEGCSIKKIARIMGLSKNTVRKYLRKGAEWPGQEGSARGWNGGHAIIESGVQRKCTGEGTATDHARVKPSGRDSISTMARIQGQAAAGFFLWKVLRPDSSISYDAKCYPAIRSQARLSPSN